jgi:hypothetical protein
MTDGPIALAGAPADLTTAVGKLGTFVPPASVSLMINFAKAHDFDLAKAKYHTYPSW